MEDLINSIGLPLIAAVVPVIVAGFKKLLPGIPPLFLPILAAVIGPAGALAVSWLSGIEASGWVMALLGVAGVGIRELFDQLGKAIKGAA